MLPVSWQGRVGLLSDDICILQSLFVRTYSKCYRILTYKDKPRCFARTPAYIFRLKLIQSSGFVLGWGGVERLWPLKTALCGRISWLNICADVRCRAGLSPPSTRTQASLHRVRAKDSKPCSSLKATETLTKWSSSAFSDPRTLTKAWRAVVQGAHVQENSLDLGVDGAVGHH